MRINISENLRRNISNVYGDVGERWLDGLPSELDAACARWGLTSVEAHPVQSFNHVVMAVDGAGRRVVLKQGVPSKDSRFETIAMEAFAGAGAARVLSSDHERGWLLLQRLEPGQTLLTLSGERERILAISAAALRLWSIPVERGAGLPHIRGHFGLLDHARTRPELRSAPNLLELVERARRTFHAIQDDTQDRVLHGDLHHFNLISDGDGWAVIDAKGVIGNPLYDIGAYLRNPLPQAEKPSWDTLISQRIHVFAEALNSDAVLVAQWGFCVAVLRALWGMTMGFEGWQKELEDCRLFLPHFLNAPSSEVVQ